MNNIEFNSLLFLSRSVSDCNKNCDLSFAVFLNPHLVIQKYESLKHLNQTSAYFNYKSLMLFK